MIESRASLPRPASEVSEREQQAVPRLPVAARTARLLVLVGVFLCAACGLVYELELVALASYLIGDSVTQTSVVLSVMVFAMGVGSLAAKRLRPYVALGFGLVEALLALVGGCSAMVLYAAFAWLGDGYGGWADGTRVLLVVFSLVIGVLIGAEVPLLMVLIQRVRRQDPGVVVADLFAADYVGALVGGLAFPFLLLPMLGQFTGALLTGAVNAVAGGALVLGLFRRDMTGRDRRLLAVSLVCVLAVLAACAALADDFEHAARRALYGQAVRTDVRSGPADVVLAGGRQEPVRVFVDGQLWLRGGDEPGFHRGLVSLARPGPHARVLILGGGDGLAAHETLRWAGVTRVDLVTPAPDLVHLARTDAALTALNGHALRDPRVHLTAADPFSHLRDRHRRYDLVVSDLPEPGSTASTKFYSQEFYGVLGGALTRGGRLVVRVGRPATAGGVELWTVEATLRAAGLHTVPYCVGSWGFVLAARGGDALVGAAARVKRERIPAGAARGARGAAHPGAGAGALARGSAEDPGAAGAPGGARACGGAQGGGARDVTGLRPTRVAPSTLVHPRYEG